MQPGGCVSFQDTYMLPLLKMQCVVKTKRNRKIWFKQRTEGERERERPEETQWQIKLAQEKKDTEQIVTQKNTQTGASLCQLSTQMERFLAPQAPFKV